MRERSMFFVDGFNLYYALEKNIKLHKYKWLNLRELALQFSKLPYENLQKVRYFTAYATWRSIDAVSRRRAYVKALQSVGVEVTLGRFQEKVRKCRARGGCGFLATMILSRRLKPLNAYARQWRSR